MTKAKTTAAEAETPPVDTSTEGQDTIAATDQAPEGQDTWRNEGELVLQTQDAPDADPHMPTEPGASPDPALTPDGNPPSEETPHMLTEEQEAARREAEAMLAAQAEAEAMLAAQAEAEAMLAAQAEADAAAAAAGETPALDFSTLTYLAAQIDMLNTTGHRLGLVDELIGLYQAEIDETEGVTVTMQGISIDPADCMENALTNWANAARRAVLGATA